MKQQKYSYPDEAEFLEEYGIEEDFFKIIDESIVRGEERIFNQIGSKSEVCDRLNISSESSPVSEIKVFYDKLGVRALRLTQENGIVTKYG